MLRLPSRSTFAPAAALAVAGCAEPVFHLNGGPRYPSRPPNCDLTIAASHPGPGYVEIGTITIEGDRSAGAGSYQNPVDFTNEVRPEVCAAGGEVVATEVSGFEIISRGIVFTRVPGSPTSAGTVAPVPARPAAPDACDPICSPGFGCQAGVCIPLCNPACGADETCGRDRLCHPKTSDGAPSPALPWCHYRAGEGRA